MVGLKTLLVLDSDPATSKTIEKILDVPVQNMEFSDFASANDETRPVAAFVDVTGDSQEGLRKIDEIVRSWPKVPVFAMSSPNDEPGSVGKALNAGAHDFIQKPFISAELKSRFVTRLLNVRELSVEKQIRIGDIDFLPNQSLIKNDAGDQYSISPCASRLLKTLWSAHGIILDKNLLIGRVWSDDKISINALDRQLSDIRRALKTVSKRVTIKSFYNKGVKLMVSEKVPDNAAY